MKKKNSNILWGLILIAIAALWLCSGMGLLHEIKITQIIFTVLWGGLIIDGLLKFELTKVFFGLSFLAIVWDRELGIEAITPWPVVGAALLLSIGFSLIIGGEKKGKMKEAIRNKASKSYESGEYVYHTNRFSGTQKYIDSQNLKEVELINKAGGMEVYLDKAKAADREIKMHVECYAGGIEIYIPRNWNVVSDVSCFAGAVDIQEGAPDDAINDTVLTISGVIKAGALEITRV